MSILRSHPTQDPGRVAGVFAWGAESAAGPAQPGILAGEWPLQDGGIPE
jgi:hypothetical protein